jgi:excisionase family DNA binding protein
MTPKLCPLFVADIQRRAANDHDPVLVKVAPRPSPLTLGQHPSDEFSNSKTIRQATAAYSHQSGLIPANENGLVTVREAEQMLRCCKTTVNTLINAGKLERVKVGRATRITMRSIRAITGQ